MGVSEYFYSRHSGNGAKTLDDLITVYEGEIDHDLRMLRETPVGSCIDPAVATRLVVHLTMRTAHIRSTFEQGTGKVLGAIRSLLDKSEDSPSFLQYDRIAALVVDEFQAQVNAAGLMAPPALTKRVAEFLMRERFDDILTQTRPYLASALDKFSGKVADLVRDGHNKSLLLSNDEVLWSTHLSSLSWTLCTTAGAILPDCVAIARESDDGFVPLTLSDKETIHVVILPLAHDKLLIGAKDPGVVFSIEEINAASSMCSDDFFVSAHEEAGAKYSHLIGRSCVRAITASVEEALSHLHPSPSEPGRVMSVNPNDAEGSAPSLTFSLTCSDFGDEELVSRLGHILQELAQVLSPRMPLIGLDGITFAQDYPSALTAHGVVGNVSDRNTRSVAKCVPAVHSAENKIKIIVDAVIANGLLSDDVDQRAAATHIMACMLASVAHTTQFERTLKAVPVPDPVAGYFYQAVSAVPERYFTRRASAFFMPLAGARHGDLFSDSLSRARVAVNEARLSYFSNGDLDALLTMATHHASVVLLHAAEWIGHRDGLVASEEAARPSFRDDPMASGLDLWLELLARDLRDLHDAPEKYKSESVFELAKHVERLLWLFQIFPWPMEDGRMYVNVGPA